MRFLFSKPIICWVALLTSTLAYASLGGTVATINDDAQSISATMKSSSHAHYQLYEMSQSWANIHEYSAANGKVFAVTWSGQKHPNLKELMGSHYVDFQKAFGQARRQHHHGGSIVIDSGNFHLEMGGHMMSTYGQAWLKDQLPVGMDLNEIQ